MIDAMLSLCDRHGLTQTTFAMAAYHLKSTPESELERLIDPSRGRSVTLWGPVDDKTRAWAYSLPAAFGIEDPSASGDGSSNDPPVDAKTLGVVFDMKAASWGKGLAFAT